MEKFLIYNNLLDIYAFLLTKKNLKIMELYYKENYSMQEIASILNVSKSYIGSAIKKSEKKLVDLEKQLKISQTKSQVLKICKSKNIRKIKADLTKLFS